MKNSLRQNRNDFFLKRSNPQMVVYEYGFLTSDFIKEGKKNYCNNLDSFTVDWGMPKNDNTPKN
jgi:hypothetical protein